MLRKLKWQIPGKPLAARNNWCQGPVPGRSPAVEKYCFRETSPVTFTPPFSGLQKLLSQYFVPIFVQKSNSLVGWGLNTAESTVHSALQTTLPAVIVLERPIAIVDSLLCRSLDIVEERIPVVTLPPALVSAKTKLLCVSVTILNAGCYFRSGASFVTDTSKTSSLT